MLSGEHLNNLGRNKALQLKEGMNNKRTYFNWDHLQRFYTAYSDKK